MAEAFAKMYGLDAASAGTVPSKTVNPTVAEVMQEKGSVGFDSQSTLGSNG